MILAVTLHAYVLDRKGSVDEGTRWLTLVMELPFSFGSKCIAICIRFESRFLGTRLGSWYRPRSPNRILNKGLDGTNSIPVYHMCNTWMK